MINVWCKRLSLIELIAYLWKGLFVPLTVYHDEHFATPAAKKFLQIVRKWGGGRNFQPADFDFDQRDENGHGLIYRANQSLSRCSERFLEQYFPEADERYCQMLKTYIRGYLELQIVFIVFVEARIERIGTRNNVILVEPTPMLHMLTEYYAEYGVTVRSELSFTKVLRARLTPFVFFLKHIVARILPGSVQGNVHAIRPSVWLEYSDGDRNELGFWIKHTDAGNFDIVYYFDRQDTPVTGARTSKIENRGLKWIDAHHNALFRHAHVPLPMLTGWLLRSMISPSGKRSPAWCRVFQFQERMWYSTFLAVFEKFQVKVLIQHQDRGWLQAVQAHAIEGVGGIMVGYHWSNLHFAMDNWFLNSQHVYFVWGKSMHDNLQRKGHTCSHILPSGIWLKPTAEERPADLGLLDKDLEFVLAVYDSNIAHPFRQSPTQTPETLAAFFLCILTLLEENPRWGAMLKFKYMTLANYQFCLPNGASIVKRMRHLIEEKRMVEVGIDVSPITTAENSDLGVCYVFNSAGIVSGIFGRPTVHWDCVGVDNPFVKDPNQQIFFTTLEELARAIQRFASGDKSVGDFSNWVENYNYFCDFRGDERIGMFIQAYMEEVTASHSPAHSIESVVKRYNVNNQISDDPFAKRDQNV